MPEQKMWISRPKLPKKAKVRVRKLFYRSGSELVGRYHWVVLIPSKMVAGKMRYHFIRKETWQEAHDAAFLIEDLWSGETS